MGGGGRGLDELSKKEKGPMGGQHCGDYGGVRGRGTAGGVTGYNRDK